MQIPFVDMSVIWSGVNSIYLMAGMTKYWLGGTWWLKWRMSLGRSKANGASKRKDNTGVEREENPREGKSMNK